MSRNFTILKRIAIGLGTLILVVVATGFIIIRYYEDEVVAYALGRIKEQFRSEFTILKADLTFWESFPMASIRLDEVCIMSPLEKKDTLIYAEQVLLQFNFVDLFGGNYYIREVETENAMANFIVDEDGRDNWHFWKESETDSTRFSLKLEQIHLENVEVNYKSIREDFELAVVAGESTANGDFTNDLMNLDVSLDGDIKLLESQNTAYLKNEKITLTSLLEINSLKSEIKIRPSELELRSIVMNVDGMVSYGDKPVFHVAVNSDRIALEKLVDHLPGELKRSLADYELSGLLSINSQITGRFGQNVSPVINAGFKVSEGELEHDDSGVTLSDMHGTFLYNSSNDKADELTIESFQASLEGGNVNLSGKVVNLSHPHISLDIDSRLDLGELKQFFAWDTMETCSGTISAQASISGILNRSVNDSSIAWNSIDISGQAKLADAFFKMKQSSFSINNVNGIFNLDDENATVNDLNGDINGNDFSLNGTLNNLVNYLFDDSSVVFLDAKVHSRRIDFTKFAGNENTNKTTDYDLQFPSRIHMELAMNIDEFIFRKFIATSIQGITSLRNGKLQIDPVRFSNADGEVMGKFTLEPMPGKKYRMTCSSDIRNIDISKMFYEFDNFDQDFITDHHLRGKTSATVWFDAPMTSGLDIMEDKLECIIDISIDNGRLIGLESLQQIAQYLKKNKLISTFVDEDSFAEKLKDVKFSHLENVIEIKNKIITIPVMEIKSSAMDINAQGTHSFDNVVNYTIGFYLRDILVKKEKEWEEADDGLGKEIFVFMKGNAANPQFGIDKDAARNDRKQEIAQEKKNVKALLKEELGLYKKDRSVGDFSTTSEKTAAKTTVQWGDNVPPPSTGQAPAPVKTAQEVKAEETRKKKVPKWLQEKEEEEETDH